MTRRNRAKDAEREWDLEMIRFLAGIVVIGAAGLIGWGLFEMFRELGFLTLLVPVAVWLIWWVGKHVVERL